MHRNEHFTVSTSVIECAPSFLKLLEAVQAVRRATRTSSKRTKIVHAAGGLLAPESEFVAGTDFEVLRKKYAGGNSGFDFLNKK